MAEYREFHCPYGDDFEGGDECDRCEQYELCMETYPPLNLIEIPKGATNGDMIKAIFPNQTIGCAIPITDRNGAKFYRTAINGVTDFTADWWNAPYKRGDENG